jgi:hypothetical protein
MTSRDHPADWRRLTAVLHLLAILMGVTFAVFVAQTFASPPHEDEFFYVEAFEVFRASGWVAVLRAGLPLPYLLLLRLSGAGLFPEVLVGRVLSVLASIAIVVITRRWSRSTFGLSDIATRLVTVTLCSVILAQRAPVTMAIADAVFSLVIVVTLIGMERAVIGRREGLGAASGVGWAVSCLVRPLGLVYSPGIVLGLAAVAWTRPAADRAWRTVGMIVVIAAAGMIAAQLPALIGQGWLTVERKPPPHADVTFSEIRYLSLLRQAERGRIPAPRDSQVRAADVRQYRQEHGPDSLPRTLPQRVLWSFRNMPAATIASMAVGTTYMVLRTGGVLVVLLALTLLLRRLPSPAVTFHAVVSLGYIAALAVAVIAYTETRWFFAVSCLIAGLGGYAFDRVAATKPVAARTVAVLHTGYLASSLAAAAFHILMPA